MQILEFHHSNDSYFTLQVRDGPDYHELAWRLGNRVESVKGQTRAEALKNLKEKIAPDPIITDALRATFNRLLSTTEYNVGIGEFNSHVTTFVQDVSPREFIYMVLNT